MRTTDLPSNEDIIQEQNENKVVSPRVSKANRIFLARRSVKPITRSKLAAKALLLTSAGMVLLMGIAFAVSALVNFEGFFTIRAIRAVADKKAISLSETNGFANPVVLLEAAAIDDMNNITYDWLPLDDIDKHEGSYNGEDYIAYTFFVENSGSEPLDYSSSLNVVGVTKNVDEAVRIMVYRNGEPTIYAMPDSWGGTETVPTGIVNFASETTVFEEIREDLAVNEKDRWTVVVWLEGEDAQCINDIRGGSMKLDLIMNILENEEPENSENVASQSNE